MEYLCLILIFIAFVLCLAATRTIISPGASFTLLFTFIFILSLTGWYGLYRSPVEPYLYITLGVISFVVGTFAKKKYSYKNAFYNKGKFLKSNEIFNENRYDLMIVVSLAILIVSFINIMQFIFSGGTIGDVYVVAAAATGGDENELSKGSLQVLLESYVAYPLLYSLIPVSLVEFFHTYKKKYIIIAISLTLLRVCLDARRTYLTSFIIMSVLCIYLHRKDYKYYNIQIRTKWKSFKKYALWLVLIFGWIFIFVSQQRSIAALGEDESSTIKTLTYYYGASVQFFGDCVEAIKINYTLGFSTFRGFLAPFFGILNVFGIDPPILLENANKYINGLHAHALYVSPDKMYNSFATCFYQFYCDGGVLGIIVLSFIYGFFAEYLFEKMSIKGTRCSESIYVFFFANILMLSFVNMQTTLALNFWPIIIIRFLYKKKPICHVSKE